VAVGNPKGTTTMIQRGGLCLFLLLTTAPACSSVSSEKCSGGKCDDKNEPAPDAGVQCGEGEGFCADGTCLADAKFCDGKPDCSDGSDEDCTAPHVFCGNGELILEEKLCDGVPDCSDGSDEGEACESPRCDSGEEISASKFCDGKADCPDGSDEAGCSPPRV
jgi:dystroglycan 1